MDRDNQQSLTVKEQKFVFYWSSIGNGTEAVKRAGYKVANDNVAANLAWRLLRKAKIKISVVGKLNLVGLTDEARYCKLKEIIDTGNHSVAIKALELMWKIDGTIGNTRKLIGEEDRDVLSGLIHIHEST